MWWRRFKRPLLIPQKCVSNWALCVSLRRCVILVCQKRTSPLILDSRPDYCNTTWSGGKVFFGALQEKIKKARKAKTCTGVAAQCSLQWLCSCVIVHCGGGAARWHWCRTSASVWETELPFRLSEGKHSREKWQEASRAFWFRLRRHWNNSQKQSGIPLKEPGWWHIFSVVR